MTEDERKEEWIMLYVFYSGKKWTDPPPTREEAERAWEERQVAMLCDADRKAIIFQ